MNTIIDTPNHDDQTPLPANLSITKPLLIGLLGFLFIGLFSPTASAATSSNSDYSIEIEQLNTENFEPTQSPRIPETVSPVKRDTSNGSNYTISSTIDSFAFKLSQTIIDFGALSATNPVIRTSELSFTNPSFGAQVITYENSPLISIGKSVIPDTTCDNGSCTQSVPAIWENALTYGFGYRCESSIREVCDLGFSNADVFKQFADSSANETPQPILQSTQSVPTVKGKIVYKVNISGTQPLGAYANTITFIAIPNF